ncbi:MAG TPA: F0F1 ATP synthase subunit A [Bacteroidia bacterium]|jgi:F-type H+-transporting ATPase subunit a|nr:F0F1 ATP synthase subunit A [Bacteroidia bacterium]
MRLTALKIRVLFLLAAFLSPALSFAYDPDAVAAADTLKASTTNVANAPKKKGFNPAELILEHVADAHEWHVFGKVFIPLPVIVKTDKGFEMFSSGNFRNADGDLQPYQGKNYCYAIKEGKIVVWDAVAQMENENATKTILDLSITKNVLTLFIVVALLFLIFGSVAKAYKKNPGKGPRGMRSIVEPFVIFIRDDIAKTNIGKKYERYLPFLLTVFFFIWISNMLGLIPIFPGGANLTGNIAITMTLAALVFLITTFSGKSTYWRHVFAMPGVPIGVLVILTPIEILGVFLKPFVLMIRLFANIAAGHIIALSFYALIFLFARGGENMGAGLGVSVVSVAFCVFMFLLDLLVAFLQAYVFTLLAAMYFGTALEEHHHEEHHAETAHA